MTWFRIDDEWHDHPKVRKVGNAAAGLWARCGSYVSRYTNDGIVEVDIARRYGTRKEIAALVSAGLWEPVEGGYRMHDFHDYNPTPEKVKQDRAAAAERQRRKRDKDASHGVTNGVTHTTPTRPDPTTSIESQTGRTMSTLPEPSSSVDQIAQAWAEHIASEASVPVRNHERFVAGTKRNLINERRGDIERVAHLVEPDALDVLLGKTVLPPRQAWYSDPDCQVCEGEGVARDEDDRFGACECRRAEPYETLATIHQLRSETA